MSRVEWTRTEQNGNAVVASHLQVNYLVNVTVVRGQDGVKPEKANERFLQNDFSCN